MSEDNERAGYQLTSELLFAYLLTGWSFVDLENGVFYGLAEGERETKKRQPPVPISPSLLICGDGEPEALLDIMLLSGMVNLSNAAIWLMQAGIDNGKPPASSVCLVKRSTTSMVIIIRNIFYARRTLLAIDQETKSW